MIRVHMKGEQTRNITTEVHRHHLTAIHVMSRSPVYVYNGLGVNERCRNVLYKSLSENVDSSNHTVLYIEPREIAAGVLQQSGAALLAVGGGFDLGFLEALGSQGMEQISSYVRGGGSYLGICAGGYFACDCIAFDKGGPLEVCGKRDLQFFPGLCEGPVFPGFQYQSEAGSFASELSFSSPDHGVQSKFNVYFNGGGKFLLPSSPDKEAHPSPEDKSPSVTKKNGFRHDLLGSNHSRVPLISLHCDSRHGSISAEDCEDKKRLENVGEHSRSEVQHCKQDGVTVLATYSELEGMPAAIVKSRVGSGVAVLSGPHIEYSVDALPSDDVYIGRISEKLEASNRRRIDCFRCCLQHLKLCLSP